MLKRTILILLVLVVCLTFTVSCSNQKNETTTEVSQSDPYMGDANGDGEVNQTDLTLFKAYLNGEAGEIRYEFCDLDGNFTVDSADLKILENQF